MKTKIKIGKKYIFLALVIVLIVCVNLTKCNKQQEIVYTTATAERMDVATTITATGTIEPVTQVQVGTQVSGIIDKIYVDYNSEVKRGQVIAELDKTNLVSELQSMQSNLNNAQSQLNYQQSNYSRYKNLYEKGLISANEYESARLSYEQAVQQLRVQQQNVQKAKTNLGYATITSPIDGVVLSKEVEEGQTVASAMSTPTLFLIAQDLTNMRVIANIDEADIGGVKEGQRVTFVVDAYPEDIFEGTVTQVRQQAKTSSNVVTYEVVITAPNNDLKLKPGLTANITIYINESKNVIALPTKALRFTPTNAIMTKDETIQDINANEKVWTKEGNVFKAHAVKTGINNGVQVEIISGISEGTEVLTEFYIPGSEQEEDNQPKPNFFMPGRKDKKK